MASFSVAAAPGLPQRLRQRRRRSTVSPRTCASAASASASPQTAAELKLRLLRLSARSDRGQLHNQLVWGDAYAPERTEVASVVASLEALCPKPLQEGSCDGDWILEYASAPLFVSSPFFVAVGDALGGESQASLFFKLHELQVASWGLSRYGAVTQTLTDDRLESRFVTLLFGLTVLPVIGWWKLIPSFGGKVISKSDARLEYESGKLELELDFTRTEEAEGIPLLPFLGRFLTGRDAPVGAVWRLLPWNGGRRATAALRVTYCDFDTRIVRDRAGRFFVYGRP